MAISSNLDYYKVFFYAAKHRNITRAAEELYLTQPAATRTLHSLEADLGCKLFVRNSRGVSLTTEGELLYQELIPAFERFERAYSLIHKIKELESGVIRIGVNDLSAEYMLLTKVYHFRKQHPGIDFLYNRMDSDQLFDAVANGYIDLSFYCSSNPPKNADNSSLLKKWESFGLNFHSIGDFTDCFLVGRNYAYLAQQDIGLKELSLFPLIAPIKRTEYANYYIQQARPSGELSERDLAVNGAENRISLAKQGHGFTFYPVEFVPQAISLGDLYPIYTEIPMCTHQVYVLLSAKRALSIASQALLDHLLKYSTEDFDWGEQEGSR